jgi:hypothetical protein
MAENKTVNIINASEPWDLRNLNPSPTMEELRRRAEEPTLTEWFKQNVLRCLKKETLYRVGFWLVVIFLCGFLYGMYFAQKNIIVPKLKEAVSIGALVIDQKVYDLKERM